MKTKKIITIAAVITAIVGLVSILACYLIDTTCWSWPNLLLSLGVAFLQLAIGFIVVNVFFEKKREEEEQMRENEKREREEEEKRIIKESTSIAISPCIAKFITEYSVTINNNFNNPDFINKIRSKILKADLDGIDTAAIIKYIDAIKGNYTILLNDMEMCIQQLDSIASTGLLLYDKELLTQYLAAKYFYGSFKNYSIDDTNAYRKIVKNVEGFYLAIENVAKQYSPDFRKTYLQPYLDAAHLELITI